MKADKDSLANFLRSADTIFQIPVFQRNYEWTKEQCVRLFKDLEMTAHREPAYFDHFMGTIVYMEDTDDNLDQINRIVDGQQRLITVSLLLKALSDADTAMKSKIYNQFLIDNTLSSNNHMKLKPVKQDYDAYHAVINPAFKTGTASKIFDNYHLFQKLIADSELEPIALIKAFSHFSIVKIALSADAPDEDPQLIFESLNSTGLALSASDLIRNLLLMNLPINKQEQYYLQYWKTIEDSMPESTMKDFFYAYTTLKKHEFASRKNTYSIYKDYFLSNKLSSEDALKDLAKFAKYYMRVLKHNTNDHDFNESLKHISIVNNKTPLPYILLLLDWVHTGKIEQSQANELVKLLENFLIRAKLANLSSANITMIIARLLKNNDKTIDYKTKMLSNMEDKFPTNKAVSDGLLLADFKTPQQREFGRMLLKLVDDYQFKDGTPEPAIDYVMPLNPNAHWQLDVKNAINISERYGKLLGNLALIPDSLKIKNHTFKQKQNNYKQSEFSTTEALAHVNGKWDQDAIIRRTKMLGQALLDKYPMLKFKPIDRADISGTYMLNQDVNVTGTQPTTFTIDYHDYSIKSWKSALKVLLDYIWENDSRDFRILRQDRLIKDKLFATKRSPLLLENGRTVESNFSATDIMALIKYIANILNMTNEISYTIMLRQRND